ncbi:hypothetical protein, partial [Bacillus paranthracis]|uniref:hypothetical protein n=1 Tax=Bacillus paranthracis TaxID=2026186 RepID=UPI003D6552CD
SKRLSVIFGEFKTVVIGYFTIVDYTYLYAPCMRTTINDTTIIMKINFLWFNLKMAPPLL